MCLEIMMFFKKTTFWCLNLLGGTCGEGTKYEVLELFCEFVFVRVLES
jgi:hypothetical protein